MKPLVGEGREPLLVLMAFLLGALLLFEFVNVSYGIAVSVGLSATIISCGIGSQRITKKVSSSEDVDERHQAGPIE